MSILTKEKYDDLCKKCEIKAKKLYPSKNYKSNYKIWKQSIENNVYKTYLESKCNEFEDLIKIAGLAYSWMPTMLDFHLEDIDEEKIMNLIKRFKKNDEKTRYDLVFNLAKMINNSIVGASKTLHIINPVFAPMIDSRVIRSWNKFFSKEISKGNFLKLPNTIYDKARFKKRVESYILYWDQLREWEMNLNNGVSIRDLELMFYFLGQKDKSKK